MERRLTYQITNEYSGLTIKDYLTGKGYSSQVIKELKKMEESVLLNGKWEYMTRRLTPGDELVIHIKETTSSAKIPPVPLNFEIVYEDEDILVIDKPADMPIHPSLNNYENSLANGLAYYFAQQEIPFTFRCVNRLDRDTTGLTIVAKHMLSAGILSEQVTRREIHREYRAIVRGNLPQKEGVIDAPIGRAGESIIERMVDYENGERAVTHYRVVEEKNGHSLISLWLETGRTHQIRVHMKHLGYPLIGDYLYNPDFEFMTRQALHSYKLVFTHPITHEKMEFVSGLPSDFQAVLGKES